MDVFVFLALLLWIPLSISIFCEILECECSYFNPITNYYEWKNFNWFGIVVITLLINVGLFPVAIPYWVYRIIKFLFTVGRKQEDK